MEIRGAKISDAEVIFELIDYYAQRDRMLFRPMAEIYENLQAFIVAEDEGAVVGCVMLSIIWADLAEISSLAVWQQAKGKGVGRALVQGCIERGRKLGLKKIFALTLEPGFFDRLGFDRINKSELPMKVWSDCARCPKQDHCDEIAVLKQV